MLVLTRKEGESVMIGPHTVVTMLQFRGKQIRIGIDTPKGIPVMRSEIYEKELANRKDSQMQFPEIYRIWSKANSRIVGYALEYDETSPRYDYDPIRSPKEFTLDDHQLDIFLYSSEGEAKALSDGIKMAHQHLKQDIGSEIGVVYARQGFYWVALVDYFCTTLQDGRSERVRLVDYTIYRHERTTNEA